MRVAEALTLARELGVARLDAQLLLGHRLQRERAWLIAHDDAALDADTAAAVEADLRRRAAGMPLAYLVGEREFHGLTLRVTPAVLVPRPETEGLVEWALEQLDALACGVAPTLVDLGTGSGAVALAVKHARPAVRVTATDAEPAALEIARDNAHRLGLAVEFVGGDWWQPLDGRRFDLAVSNPPYVAGDDPHLRALEHEPRRALTPEGDGLAALRRLIADAPPRLNAGAWLLLEHGHDQASAVRRLLAERGFESARTRRDLAGIERCTGARWLG